MEATNGDQGIEDLLEGSSPSRVSEILNWLPRRRSGPICSLLTKTIFHCICLKESSCSPLSFEMRPDALVILGAEIWPFYKIYFACLYKYDIFPSLRVQICLLQKSWSLKRKVGR